MMDMLEVYKKERERNEKSALSADFLSKEPVFSAEDKVTERGDEMEGKKIMEFDDAEEVSNSCLVYLYLLFTANI